MHSCPNCGSNLRFDIASQKLLCNYCNTSMDPYEYKESTWDYSKDTYDINVFTCPQCGSEIMSDDTTAAAFCSFCGASNILEGRISSQLRPNYIIPFSKTKEECKEAYRKKLRKSLFAPKELKDSKNIENFRGIYMPYWIYNFKKNGDISFAGTKSHRKGDYVITEHYNINTKLDTAYTGLSFDASASFADNLSMSIAPYDWKTTKPFTTAYLSGFYADVRDVESRVYESEAMDIAENDVVHNITANSTVKQYRVDTSGVNSSIRRAVHFNNYKLEYAMYPVWFLAYRKRNAGKSDSVLYAVVNGQTGKVAADIPIDIKKYVAVSVVLAALLFVLFNLLFSFTAKTSLIIAAVFSAITLFTVWGQTSRLKKRLSGEDDLGLKNKKIRQTEENISDNKTIKENTTNNTSKVVLDSADRHLSMYPLLAIILCALVFFIAPVSDIYYYACIIISLVLSVISFMGIIKIYNKITERMLPQFNRMGGDDRA